MKKINLIILFIITYMHQGSIKPIYTQIPEIFSFNITNKLKYINIIYILLLLI